MNRQNYIIPTREWNIQVRLTAFMASSYDHWMGQTKSDSGKMGTEGVSSPWELNIWERESAREFSELGRYEIFKWKLEKNMAQRGWVKTFGISEVLEVLVICIDDERMVSSL